MHDEREPTRDEQAKAARSFRTSTMMWLALGVVFLTIGVLGLAHHQYGAYTYADFVFGLGWFGLAWLYWSRSRPSQ
ncbi:MAG TPA: hypothetical protein VNF68_05505 [Candidatus Baltobacteraceae bacterium]|nr:hypothetical protein [Candidatus Baltobacteraceae bacterium]